MALFGKFNKDELINKAKQTASSVTDKAKSAAEGVKASMDEKKAEKEAYEGRLYLAHELFHLYKEQGF